MATLEEKTGGSCSPSLTTAISAMAACFRSSSRSRQNDRPFVRGQPAKWERLYEITQIKGDGEAHPFLSPNDEFANYERWDKGNLDCQCGKRTRCSNSEYSRSTFQERPQARGQIRHEPLQVRPGRKHRRPYRYRRFRGRQLLRQDHIRAEAERATHPVHEGADGQIMGWEQSRPATPRCGPQENTRAAIFDAMKRRETYATTGSRMVVRFFGGWDFEVAMQQPHAGQSRLRQGRAHGRRSGRRAAGKSPSFLIAALKDPIGANLDRVQVIKGWLDKAARRRSASTTSPVSDGRKIDPDGRCKTEVGNTVDVPNATWTNYIGASELITVWKDPQFDPALRAFYYVRVIEIPTPRWTAYDAKYYGVRAPDFPMITTERAYTSPIWYTPAK